MTLCGKVDVPEMELHTHHLVLPILPSLHPAGVLQTSPSLSDLSLLYLQGSLTCPHLPS